MNKFINLLLSGVCVWWVFAARPGWGATHVVTMANNQFSPRDITIQIGDTVTWTNRDNTGHDTVSGASGVPSGVWDSNLTFRRLMRLGESFSFTFTNTQVGVRIPYYCTPHWRTFNMVGSITVIVPNNPPSVSIISPVNGATFNAGDNVPIQAMLSDSDGTIERADFTSNGNLIGSITNPANTVTIILTNISEGNYLLSCVAVDDRGAFSAPAIVNIGVGPPMPPSIIAQPTALIVRPGTSNAFIVSATGTPPLTYQWQFNGNDIPDATNEVYSISNIGTNDVGAYRVLVNDRLDLTTASESVNLIIDFTRPTLALTNSLSNSLSNFNRPTTNIVTLSGTASDDIGLDQVKFQVNHGPFLGSNGAVQTAEGTTNWTAKVTLSPGNNSVRMYSEDLAGNVSLDETRFFTYVVTDLLKLTITGSGTVTPNLTSRPLEIGQIYTLKAVPNSGYVFAGWGFGGLAEAGNSNNAALSFVMQSNLVLTANFTNNPFTGINGNYAGLFANTNAPALDSSGFFTVQIGSLGAFSGKLMVDGQRFSFRGLFNHERHAKLFVPRRRLTPISMTLDLDPAAGVLRGSVTNDSWAAELLGYRNQVQFLSPPATKAGPYSFRFERKDGGTVGTNSARINASGQVRYRGSLNGHKFTMTSSISGNGDSPFYASPKGGNEAIIGWLHFPANETMSHGTNIFWVQSATNTLPLQLDAVGGP